jgi:hypothetical protein
MRPRRRLDPAESAALREAVRRSFSVEEQQRNDEFAEQMKRILSHLDEFAKSAGDA